MWQEFRPRSAHGNRSRSTSVKWALRDVSYSVARGETVALIGHNGSGKTTMLRTLAGVLKPSRGRCDVQGRISSLIDLTAGVNRDLTGRENIILGGVLLGMTRAEVREQYDAIADFSGISDAVLNQPLSVYSSGMGLRIAFSVVVHANAEVLLVDEVLAVGDLDFQQTCLEKIDAFRNEGGSIVMASHDLEQVQRFCDRAMVFHEGQLVFNGAPAEAVAHYSTLGPDPSVLAQQRTAPSGDASRNGDNPSPESPIAPSPKKRLFRGR